jgi:hypothetical protein
MSRRNDPSLSPTDRIKLAEIGNSRGLYPLPAVFAEIAHDIAMVAIKEDYPIAATLRWLYGRGRGFPRSQLEDILTRVSTEIFGLDPAEAAAVIAECRIREYQE